MASQTRTPLVQHHPPPPSTTVLPPHLSARNAKVPDNPIRLLVLHSKNPTPISIYQDRSIRESHSRVATSHDVFIPPITSRTSNPWFGRRAVVQGKERHSRYKYHLALDHRTCPFVVERLGVLASEMSEMMRWGDLSYDYYCYCFDRLDRKAGGLWE